MPRTKVPEPEFDLMLPRTRHKNRRHPVELTPTEDPELTAFLMAEIEEAYSLSLDPPACFYCQSSNTVLRYKGISPTGTPYFSCKSCGQGFSRRTGTALVGFRKRESLTAFVPMLSQQMTMAEAADRLDVMQDMVARWVRVFRAWLLDLDPSGRLHAKIKLGIKPSVAHLACPHCGVFGQLDFAGYAPRDNGKKLVRQFQCNNCRKTSRLDQFDQAP
ncbi:DUF746 domain-containing protein [Rhizobium sp. LEGMi198b]